MTHRERILTALGHRAPDRVPVDFGGTGTTTITAGAYRRLCAHLGLDARAPVEPFARRASTVMPCGAAMDRFGADALPLLCGTPDARPERETGPGFLIDEWGVTWHRSGDTHYMPVHGPLTGIAEPEPADLDRIEWPDAADPGRYRGLRDRARVLHETTDRAVILNVWLGPVHVSQFLRGYSEWLEDVLLRPGFVTALLDRVTQLWVEATTRALAECGDSVDVVMFGDDVGTQRGPLMRPEAYRRLVKPYHARLAAAAKSTGKPLLFHSCGAVRQLIPDLIEIGVDALNPVQAAAAGMDTGRLKREFGRDIAFWGGIDTQHVLPHGSREAVRQEVRRRLDDLHHDGGYVLCGVHNIQDDVPPENVTAMYDAALEFGG
jgi:uroporphyrinogen decarboxylase